MRFLQAFLFIVVAAVATDCSHGYLGGFEPSDGYRDIPRFNNSSNVRQWFVDNPVGSGEIWEVALYNAGQFGSVTGGADNLSNFPAPFTPGTLWSRSQGNLQPALGNQTTTNDRKISYATGHRGYDRSYVNSFPGPQFNRAPAPTAPFPPPGQDDGPEFDLGLVITTNADGWPDPGAPPNGPANVALRSQYIYQLDQYDWQGASASGTSTPTEVPESTVLDISFWSCSQIPGPDDVAPAQPGGVIAGSIGNTLSFRDSNTGIVGFEVGYIQPGTALDNAWYNAGDSAGSPTSIGTGGTPTSIPITLNRYHRWDIKLDMLSDTVEASIFDPFAGPTGTTYQVIPAGTPTSGDMTELTELVFTTSAGVTNRKIWSVDDFDFEVIPEPTSTSLILLGLMPPWCQ